MAGSHVGIVFRRSRHRTSELLVLACIAETLNQQTGSWHLYTSEIAARCKLSERSVYRAIAALQDSRELVVRRHGGPDGQNRYWLGPALLVEPPSAGLAPDAPVGLEAHPPDAGVRLEAVDSSSEPTPMAGAPDTGVTPNLTPMAGAPDTGVTLNHISHHDQISQRETDDMSKAKAREIAGTLRAAGIRNAKATQQLVELVTLGAGTEDLLAAVKEAQGRGIGDPFAYAVTVVLNRLRMQSAPAPAPAQAAAAGWEHAPKSQVEACGVELGIGKWDELLEQWERYKARVRAAMRKSESGAVA